MRHPLVSTVLRTTTLAALTALSCCGGAGNALPTPEAGSPTQEPTRPDAATTAGASDAGASDAGASAAGASRAANPATSGPLSSEEPAGDGIDPKVQNGTVYDKATVDASTFDTVVIPASARLVRGGKGRVVSLYMAKTLGFVGHPSEPESFLSLRKSMGCATKADGKTLLVDTFGAWDSHKEGGADIALLVVAPDGVKVEARPIPSGVAEVGYAPREVPKGWTVVGAAPDPERHAKPAP